MPSENLTSRRSVNVKVFASFETFHDRASHGSGVVDWPRNVSEGVVHALHRDLRGRLEHPLGVDRLDDERRVDDEGALGLRPSAAAGADDATTATTARTAATSAAGRARRGTRAALCM